MKWDELFSLTQRLPEGKAINVPFREMKEAAECELESLIYDYVHDGETERFAQKIAKNWGVNITHNIGNGIFTIFKPNQ